MKFSHLATFWITDFGWPDVSFGIHISFYGRLDIHFLKWMISLGSVPIYTDKNGKEIAVSNSYHITQTGSIRAGTP